MKNSLFILLLLSGINIAFGRTTHAEANGLWHDPVTWDNGIPQCGDTVYIDSNIKVTVDLNVNMDETAPVPACSSAFEVYIYGEFHFNTGKKAYFACNSHITIYTGGSLTKGAGEASSNIIQICGVTVWSAADGDLSGPAFLGPPLPITLYYFKAEAMDKCVELRWATLSEINNDYFSVERSSDLTEIEEIAQVNGTGDSRTLLEYEFTDADPQMGFNYYRLKQTDFNNAFSYSDWDVVNFQSLTEEHIKIGPTVTSGPVFIEINNTIGAYAYAVIYDLRGIKVYGEKTTVAGSPFLWNLDLKNHMRTGYYILKVEINSIIKVVKLRVIP